MRAHNIRARRRSHRQTPRMDSVARASGIRTLEEPATLVMSTPMAETQRVGLETLTDRVVTGELDAVEQVGARPELLSVMSTPEHSIRETPATSPRSAVFTTGSPPCGLPMSHTMKAS